jgi:alpha-mannosidase
MDSTISQNLWLYTACPRIDFETDIDWHQHHQILKTAFPLDVHTNTATYDIQFGHTSRPTHQNTSWDKAKFETCGHKWVDMSENGYGVALLNDCKYGHSAEGSTLKLTILKCGTYPNPEADQGRHLFTYSLLPHAGDFRAAGVINEAYALNQPLCTTEVKRQVGTLPEQFSLVSCNKPNIIIETVKKAEEDESMLVRMYEAFDSRGEVTVTVPSGFKKAYLCNLMEKELKRLDLKDGKVNIPYKNFEIITLKFSK